MGTQLIKVDHNACLYYREKLINKSREPEHVLIMNFNGENILESRVLDKKNNSCKRNVWFPRIYVDRDTELYRDA